MLTDFGKLLKKLIVDADISQGQLAKDLDISPGMLSNYMTGKNVPEMKMLEKCINRFKLKRENIRDIFLKTFSSTARNNYKIILDTQYFTEERIDLLVQALTILLLAESLVSLRYGSTFIDLKEDIEIFYTKLDQQIKFEPL
jgi:transcriptional regulator with XRE-family HTH domain